MEFVRVRKQEEAAQAVLKRLRHELKQGHHVLWLLSGGSNIGLAVGVMHELEAELTKHLVISLADERYGEVGHVNSNVKQLTDAGLEMKDAVFVPVLQPGFSAEETTERFADAMEQSFTHADTVIALLGMGKDGHIAGLLPHTPSISATGWVTSYRGWDFQRVSLTFAALEKVTTTYVCVWGEEKRGLLTTLRDESLPLEEQPAQFLKRLREVNVYNDQIGGK